MKITCLFLFWFQQLQFLRRVNYVQLISDTTCYSICTLPLNSPSTFDVPVTTIEIWKSGNFDSLILKRCSKTHINYWNEMTAGMNSAYTVHNLSNNNISTNRHLLFYRSTRKHRKIDTWNTQIWTIIATRRNNTNWNKMLQNIDIFMLIFAYA